MKRILCFGDSNVFGYDPRSYLGGRYPADIRWPGVLSSYGWDIVNLGENGLQIPSTDWELQFVLSDIERFLPIRHFLIMLGGNDLLCHSSFVAENVADRMERFVKRLTAQFPVDSIQYWLIAPPPMVLGTWVAEDRLLMESSRLSECYRDVALRCGIRFLDSSNWNVELSFDGVHFSSAGHISFAQKLMEILSADEEE